jgi:hypothetical protein
MASMPGASAPTNRLHNENLVEMGQSQRRDQQCRSMLAGGA